MSSQNLPSDLQDAEYREPMDKNAAVVVTGARGFRITNRRRIVSPRRYRLVRFVGRTLGRGGDSRDVGVDLTDASATEADLALSNPTPSFTRRTRAWHACAFSRYGHGGRRRRRDLEKCPTAIVTALGVQGYGRPVDGKPLSERSRRPVTPYIQVAASKYLMAAAGRAALQRHTRSIPWAK